MDFQNDNNINKEQASLEAQNAAQAKSEQNQDQQDLPEAKLQECKLRTMNNEYRRALIFSALSIVLSPFVVIGIIFAFLGVANARNELAYTKDSSTKPSQTLLWAYWVGITGMVVNIAVLVTYILFAAL